MEWKLCNKYKFTTYNNFAMTPFKHFEKVYATHTGLSISTR